MNGPVSPQLFTNFHARRATVADMPWMLDVAEECYPGRGVKAGWEWMKWNIENTRGDTLVLLGFDSFIVARVLKQYGFELRARVDMLCARKSKRATLEALKLVKAATRWAAILGVTHPLKLDADTGVDFGPFARRLGGRPCPDIAYEIPLSGGEL